MNKEQILSKIKIEMALQDVNQLKLSELSSIPRQTISRMLNNGNWTKLTMVRVLDALELKELSTLLK